MTTESKRRAQARQQGPRVVFVGLPAHRDPPGTLWGVNVSRERPPPDVACDWCGGAHGTRMCPNARTST